MISRVFSRATHARALSRILSAIILSVILSLGIVACGGSSAGGGDGNGNNDGGEGGAGSDRVARSDLSGLDYLMATEQAVSQEPSRGADGTPNLMSGNVPQPNRVGEEPPLANLLGINAEGVASPAVDSDRNIFVLYSEIGPSQDYLYVALSHEWRDGEPYDRYIGETECAIWRIPTADSSDEQGVEWQCVARNLLPTGRPDEMPANEKPFLFDALGNLYFLADEFDADCANAEESGRCQLTTADGEPRIYRIDTPDEISGGVNSDSESPFSLTVMTHDTGAIDHFLPLSDGTLAYLQERVLHFRSGDSTTEVADDVFSLIRDDRDTVMFRTASGPLAHIAVPRAEGGVLRSTIAYHDGVDVTSHMYGDLIEADDGNIYLIGLKGVLQVLPYREVPVVSHDDEDWRFDRLPVLVNKGLFFSAEEVSLDFGGTAEVIRVLRKRDGNVRSLLDPREGSNRYRISRWQVVGDELIFAAEEMDRSRFVVGTIDLVGLRNGDSRDEILSVTEAASAEGAIAQVRDIQPIRPQRPDVDTGHVPQVVSVTNHVENPYTASLHFSKYMNHESVEDGLDVCCVQDTNSQVGWVPFWTRQSLHMIFDQEGFSDLEGAPLDIGGSYAMTLDANVRDAWDWELGADYSAPIDIRPEGGVYMGRTPGGTGFEGVSSGNVARLRSRNTESSYDRFALVDAEQGDAVELHQAFQMEISLSTKNVGGSNFNDGNEIVLWTREEDGSNGREFMIRTERDAFDPGVIRVELQAGMNSGGELYTASVDIPADYGPWARLAVKRFGTSVQVGYLDRDGEWVWPEAISADSLPHEPWAGADAQFSHFHVVVEIENVTIADDFVVHPIDESGEVIEGDAPLFGPLSFENESELSVFGPSPYDLLQ